MMGLFLLTLGIFAVAMLIMAIGAMLQGRCLRGSCGGPEVVAGDGTPLSCAACPRRREREKQQRSALLPTVQ